MRNKETIRYIFADIVGGKTLDERSIHQHFSADYEQKVDGKTLNLEQFIEHMRLQKQHIHEVKTTFLTLVEEGHTVFSHHIVHAEKQDGSRIAVQVIAQFDFDDEGKIRACDELTRLLEGTSEDADIGSRH
ncbi:MAG: hypothetical protein Q4A74_01490 [Cardiobacteriaceae bacterium]|nr:hypothetical protein [Cardiobacteriaceae bacterium]